MPEPKIFLVGLSLALSALAGIAVLIRAAAERDRLWSRYEQMKTAEQRHRELAARRAAASKLVANRADLAPSDDAIETAQPAQSQ